MQEAGTREEVRAIARNRRRKLKAPSSLRVAKPPIELLKSGDPRPRRLVPARLKVKFLVIVRFSSPQRATAESQL